MENDISNYYLYLPLNVEPSWRFKSFIKELGQPLQYDCCVQYWRKKLRFSSSTMPTSSGGIGSESFLDPDGVKVRFLSEFASKFNCAMSVPKYDREFSIEIIEDSPMYDSKYLLKVTIAAKSLAAQMAIENFFKLIETSKYLGQ